MTVMVVVYSAERTVFRYCMPQVSAKNAGIKWNEKMSISTVDLWNRTQLTKLEQLIKER